MDWVKQTLLKARIDYHTEIFHKGREGSFNGMVFVKFRTVEQRDNAIRIFNALKTGLSDGKSFMSPDLPIESRVPRSFLFKFKKLLTDCLFNRSSVYVDPDLGTISVEGLPILKVVVQEFELKLEWLADAWKEWEDLHRDPSFTEIWQASQESLKTAKQRMCKGKGRTAA